MVSASLEGHSGLSSNAMVDQMLLSSLLNGKYVLRASCTRKGECNCSWEIDINQAVQTMGDIPLPELRQKLRCPECDAPITTTLISLK
jgi:hypothetical protein